MVRLGRSAMRFDEGFTLVELLTVIALIIAIAALAVPNFSSMMREQHWTSAISALQVAIMRAKAYAVNTELDCAVEFCKDQDNVTYLRIEAESGYLEHVPNIKQLLNLCDSLLGVPLGWYHAFISRRDAWGSDGNRLRSGMWDCYWVSGGIWSGSGWGYIKPNTWWDHSNNATCRLLYDHRYTALTGYTKANLSWPYQFPAAGAWNAISIDERNNVAGTHGYQDVNDEYDYYYQSTEYAGSIRDNLAVDDFLYLPHDIQVDDVRSTLTNYDADRNSAGNDVVHHGWDGTKDLRFGKGGHLLQTQTAEVALTRKDGEVVRTRLLRGTGRLKKIQ